MHQTALKAFSTYQFLEGTEMTDRDKKEIGSKFWNKGKWDNFVLPFLKERGTFIDMGCNAGLFLLFAQQEGFDRIIGVDSDEGAVKRGLEWRDTHGGKYDILLKRMEECIDDLPVADYTVFANAHYYFTINDWLDYLDKLQYKTRYCIIVTAEKRHGNRCWAQAHVPDIRNYFKTWKEEGFIDELPLEGDPMPRRLWGLLFKSPHLEKVPIGSLDCGNHVQDQFYAEIDKGVPYQKTRYYRILKPYRKKWSEDRLNKWVEERIRVYQDLKKNGLKKPLIINSSNLILDGNHRYSMMKHLGYKEVIVRRT